MRYKLNTKLNDKGSKADKFACQLKHPDLQLQQKRSDFKALYTLHWSELYAYAFNILREKGRAEDIVQEVFTDYWNRMETIKAELPRAYLFQAVRNQCARKLKNREFNNIQIEQIAALIPELEEQNYAEVKNRLMEEVESTATNILPEKCLQIFRLRFYQQLTYKEIASQLDISERTVENQVSKALRLLRNSAAYPVDVALIIAILFRF